MSSFVRVVVVCLTLCPAVSSAQESRPVHLPLIFDAEGASVRTEACLAMKVWEYPSDRWWESERPIAPAGSAFRRVLVAMKEGNQNELERLSTVEPGADPAQARSLLKLAKGQIGSLEIVEVTLAYEFDGLLAFFAKVRVGAQFGFVPFVFSLASDEVKFLPQRTTLIAYKILGDWFESKWGPGGTGPVSYCSSAEIARASHAVPLTGRKVTEPSRLLLTGGSTADRTSTESVSRRVELALRAMKTALEQGFTEFAAHLTNDGATSLLAWAATASEPERSAYRRAILSQEVFFVFDASPVLVAYTRSAAGVVQVMYFTATSAGDLRWTNASYLAEADAVFKRGPLFDASIENRPFARLAVKAP